MTRLIWRPIDRWPREQTTSREESPFRARRTVTTSYGSRTEDAGEVSWPKTRVDLERELGMLRAPEAVVQLALTDADIRIDGEIRANARLRHPGVVLTFTAPKKGVLTFACDKWTTWQCLGYETSVLTWSGPRVLGDLAGTSVDLMDRRGGWSHASVAQFAPQRLFRVVLTRSGVDREVFATRAHRWFVERRRIAAFDTHVQEEMTTAELNKGHCLPIVFGRGASHISPSEFGIVHGIVFGDGNRKSQRGSGCRVVLCGEKDAQLLKWFPLSATRSHPAGILIDHLPRLFKDPPPMEESSGYLLGWLAGYFAADGSVAEDGYTRLTTVDKRNVEAVEAVCARLGIGIWSIRRRQLETNKWARSRYAYEISFVRETLRSDFFLLSHHRDRFEHVERKARRSVRWRIATVERTNRVEETFCAVVPNGGAFVLDGNILTGNSNIRGIAKGLEALRLLDRYGIVTSGEQYTGWKELPSGVPLSERSEPEPLTLEEAARVIVGWISGAHDLAQNARTAIEDADYRRYAYRQALKHLHPDAGGDDSDAFLRLQQAIKMLDEND